MSCRFKCSIALSSKVLITQLSKKIKEPMTDDTSTKIKAMTSGYREVASSYDEELDYTSKKFNPLKALYSEELQPKNDRKFDNVSSFEAQIRMAGNSFDVDLNKFAEQRRKKQAQETEPVDEEKFHVTAAGRKFLKEQGESTTGHLVSRRLT